MSHGVHTLRYRTPTVRKECITWPPPVRRTKVTRELAVCLLSGKPNMLRVRTLARFFLATGAQLTPPRSQYQKISKKASLHGLPVTTEILPFLSGNSVWT